MTNNERRVAIIRESIVKVTRILTGRGIRVTQAGMNAYVEYHPKTLEPIRVNIPYLPDDASEALIQAIEGFLDHEIGHLLFTNSRAVKEATIKKVAALHNIVEDVFVERAMRKKFSGSAYNLQNMYHIFTDKFIIPKLAELARKPDATERDYWRTLVACAIRALGGQKHFQEFMSERWSYLPNIHKALLPFETRLQKTKNSFENLELALEIKDAVYGEPPKEEEKEEPPKEEPKDFDDKEEEDDTESSSSSEDFDDEESEKQPEPKPSHDDFDDEEDFDEEPDSEPEESEEMEHDDFDDEDGFDDESESEEEPGGEPERSFSDDEESEEDFDDAEEDESEPEKEEEDSELELEDEEPEEEGSDLSSDYTGDDDSDAKELSKPLMSDEADEDFESMDDFDDAMSDLVSEMSERDSSSSTYVPFTKDWDDISTFEVPERFNETWIKSIEDKVVGMTGTLQKGLERAFKAANRARWEGGKKKGRINTAALTRLLNNDPRVFRTREEIRTKEVAVSLLIDCSGSMGGSRIHTAVESAWALSEVLSKLGINFEVLGFTTKHHAGEAGKYLDEMRESGKSYDRLEPIYIPIFKAFNERFGIEPKRRMASITQKGFLMNNVDGESLQYAAERLRRQKENGKTLIVLSDGQPAAHGNATRFRVHLKKVVKDLEKEKINVVGIGIQTESVRDYFKNRVVLNRVEDLPTEIMHQLRDAIMQKA